MKNSRERYRAKLPEIHEHINIFAHYIANHDAIMTINYLLSKTTNAYRHHTVTAYTKRNVGTDCTYIIKGGFLNIILGHSCAATAVCCVQSTAPHILLHSSLYYIHHRPRAFYTIIGSLLWPRHAYTRAHAEGYPPEKYNCIREFLYYTFVTYISI